MANDARLIYTAEFNSRIKTYRLLTVAFFLGITFVGIPLMILWFLGFGQYYTRRYYRNLQCRLTDRHLEFKKGVLFRVEKTIPLENIQDLTFIDNPLLQVLDLRILKIETAGHSNPQGSDMKLIGIMNTSDFKDRVLDQREVLMSEKGHSQKEPSAKGSELMDVLTEIKGLLEDIKKK